ncbi:MAG: hypothetical protein QOG10_5092 [Kribbellaceae bacterium]|nr:hypothetical protein [Kribbellaceae bacterium]
MTSLSWDDLIGQMRAVVLQLEALLTPAEVDMIWELVDVDEPVIGFEMLCTQLYEHDAEVEDEVIDRLQVIGTAMQLEPRQWEILRADRS